MTAPALAAWPPAGELPTAAIHRVWAIEFAPEAAIATGRLPGDPVDTHKLPQEFYLDGLLRIDLDNDEAIRDFIQEHGFLFGRLPDVDHASLTVPLTEPGGLLGSWVSYGLARFGRGHELSKARSALMWERFTKELTTPFELIAETRLGLCWLRDLTRLAIAYQSNRLDMWMSEVEWDSARFQIRRPISSQEAFAAFVVGINSGLRTFHPFLYAPEIIEEPAYATSLAMGAPPPYSVIVSQIFNHISEDVAYRICQNATCPRPYKTFVRQTKLDGSISEAPRSTAIYCSITCKNAQKQRERRKKKARERTQA